MGTPALWREWQGRLLPFCAECAAGFAVPRHWVPDLGDRHWAERLGKRVVEQTGADVTADFRRGAELTLAFAHRHGIHLAVLKEKSPSCDVNIIYDGSFSGRQIAGEGVVAALLRQHGIQVFSEHELERVQPWLEAQ
ncbi:DUF523 domain-containing protein [Deinococcus cavernae]|uniref:DUF523 domain-containing protein n=1 Tax=Deinococcus cavernae TaxID=2320857 RepID=UPI0018F4A47B|nr:DUF523 domain-containing protein [Deinococcus cavernae]